jgi:dolichyl-phosphooligosaccharide-protein glycotransferase
VLTPEYGVLADWGLGAYIVNIARRPTVATNFGWETHGLFESALFHAQTDPEAALQVIAENRVRYVMVNQFTSSIDNHRSIAEYAVKSGRAGAKRLLGRHDPRKTMYFRLMEHDASAYMENGTLVRALGNYRLLHESTLGQIHLLKLFEVVPGAMLVGRGKPGDNVDIRLELRSPVGRNISYLDRTLVEDDGTYRFRVPYSSVVSSGIIIPLSPYQVQAGGKTHFVRVNEEDVRQGKPVGIH